MVIRKSVFRTLAAKGLVLLLLSLLSVPLRAQKGHNFEVSKNLEVFNSIFRQLDMYYVDTLSSNKLIKDAAGYMLSTLDPYTEYYANDEREDFRQMITGKYAGIGAVIHYYKKKDRCIIAEPYENTPAAESGARAGDVILSINGKDMNRKAGVSVADYTSQVSQALRGQPGTEMTLVVERPGREKTLALHITRRNIQLPSIPFYGIIGEGVGYIALSSFTEDCAAQVKRAVVDLKAQSAKSLVLDLRDNGGGSMGEAVDIVGLFVPRGSMVVQTRGKTPESNSIDKTKQDPLDVSIPLCVLVNGNSASASEIVSGALQDLDRAVIVGSRTYGKGLVQQTRELPYNGVLKLTTAKYYIPSGRCVQAIDYARRSADGVAQRIPDSLTHVFHTLSGREVRDGGGIRPDIAVRHDSLASIVLCLMPSFGTSDVAVDYVTDYCLRHERVAAPDSFVLSDEEYEIFAEMVRRENPSYDQYSLRLLRGLREMAAREGYGEKAKAELDALERKLARDISHDLSYWKKDLCRMLEGEIMKRYYYQRGYLRNLLNGDKDLLAALEALHDGEAYRDILKKKKK